MGEIRSRIHPSLTLEYIITGPENKLFDRKSSMVRPVNLAPLISAFANAEGGTIAIGINEKSRSVEGIDTCGSERINNFIAAHKTCCKPMPRCQEEFIEVENQNGERDRLLLLHIEASIDQVIRTSNDSTFLRIGNTKAT